MTAVEWLEQEMINNGLDYPISKMSKILEQAKEMEKQQIIDAHLAGQNSAEEIDGENELQYYKNTYGSKESGCSEKPNDHIVDSNKMIPSKTEISDKEIEEQNGFFANTLLAAVPIVSTHLEDKYGFECKVDYDKDFATDDYYSLKIATYKKKVVGDLEIHIIDSFKFVETPDTYKYLSTTVEIVQGTKFQKIKIDKMWQLLMLIDMLQGVQRHSS